MSNIDILDKYTPIAFKTGFLKELLKIKGVVLAGGSIRDTIMEVEPKDYDIFFTDYYARLYVELILKEKMRLIDSTYYTQTYCVDHCTEYDYPITVQLIHKQVYSDKKSIVDNFDFTNVMLAIDKDGIEIGEKTLEDIHNKKVGISVITKPLDSLNRLNKYSTSGHNIEEAYYYILSVMKDANPSIVLNSVFYEGSHIIKKKSFVLTDVKDKVLIIKDFYGSINSNTFKDVLDEYKPKGLLGIIVLGNDYETKVLTFDEMESIIRECQAMRSPLARLLSKKI